MPADPLVAVLGRISRAVSQTLEPKEVFARVAEAAATILPFDVMLVGRLEAPDTLTLYAVAGSIQDPPRTIRLEDFSPMIRVQPGRIVRIEDADRELDSSFAFDRELRRQGVRSGLRAPLLRGEQLAGAVSLWSRRPGAFSVEHEAALEPISDLLGLAIEHERLWSLDMARRRRLDVVDSLLQTMAESLDVREIFHRVSEVVQPVLPHDRLMLTSLSADRSEITVDALSGEAVPAPPPTWPGPGSRPGLAGTESGA